MGSLLAATLQKGTHSLRIPPFLIVPSPPYTTVTLHHHPPFPPLLSGRLVDKASLTAAAPDASPSSSLASGGGSGGSSPFGRLGPGSGGSLGSSPLAGAAAVSDAMDGGHPDAPLFVEAVSTGLSAGKRGGTPVESPGVSIIWQLTQVL